MSLRSRVLEAERKLLKIIPLVIFIDNDIANIEDMKTIKSVQAIHIDDTKRNNLFLDGTDSKNDKDEYPNLDIFKDNIRMHH